MIAASRLLQRPIAWVLLTVGAHLVAIALLPHAWSYDMKAWLRVADFMRMGLNPYEHTGHLNWPPLWPTIIFLLDRIATGMQIPLERCIQGFLIGVDVLNVLLLRRLALRNGTALPFTTPLLLGLALNPIPILQAVMHCNFDAIVGTWMILMIGAFWRYVLSGLDRDWLLACFLLGMGVLTKTIPLILLPLALVVLRQPRLTVLLRGVVLAVAPVLAGILPLMIAHHGSIIDNVITYRGYAGWYGITGLLPFIGAAPLQHLYASVSPLLMGTAALAVAWRARSRGGMDRPTILRATLLCLLCITLLGPGYAPQYIGWTLPLLVLLYWVGRDSERRLLKAALVVFTLTYLVEYALIPSHGAFLTKITDVDAVARWSEALVMPAAQTLLRLPLFLCQILLSVLLWRNLRAPASTNPIPA
ncbi:MAG: hypothetical protein IPL52_08975 [Flavobacteriales bacterium]|nr:hypothetical protein [Flavobacteriales bacterium]